MNKSNFLGLGVLSVALLTGAAVSAAEIKTTIDTNTAYTFDGTQAYTLFWLNPVVKLNDRWSISPEFATQVFYKQTDPTTISSPSQSLFYLRFAFVDGKFAKLGDWKISMAYRYSFPFDPASQDSGSMGTVRAMPTISRDFGWVNVQVFDGVYLFLQHKENGLSGKGAKLFGNVFGGEVNFKFPVKGLSLDVLVDTYNFFVGVGKGTDNHAHSYQLEQQVELDYDLESVPGFTLGLGVYSLAAYGNDLALEGKKFLFWGKTQDNYAYINAQYAF